MFNYIISGILVQSELRIPVFEQVWNSDRSDTYFDVVSVRVGECPGGLPNSIGSPGPLIVNREAAIAHTPNGGRLFLKGKEIIIDPRSSLDMDVVADYTAAIFLPILGYVNKRIPLHAAAIESDQGIVLICGASGHGKSTLSSRMSRELGWTILHDDLVILDPDFDGGVMRFGLPRLKLWSDSVEQLGMAKADLRPDRAREGKFHVQFEAPVERLTSKIAAIVNLSWADGPPQVRRLRNSELFTALMNTTYWPELAYWMNQNAHVRLWAAQFSSKVHGLSFSRSKSDKFEDLDLRELERAV